MADREGFEPSNDFHRYTLSRRAPSTTRPPVRTRKRGDTRGRPTPQAIWKYEVFLGKKRMPPEFSPGPSLTLRAFAARNGPLDHFVRAAREPQLTHSATCPHLGDGEIHAPGRP